jgi:hypothetical protein
MAKEEEEAEKSMPDPTSTLCQFCKRDLFSTGIFMLTKTKSRENYRLTTLVRDKALWDIGVAKEHITVDLFASNVNASCPLYITKRMDAFTYHWPSLCVKPTDILWANPPIFHDGGGGNKTHPGTLQSGSSGTRIQTGIMVEALGHDNGGKSVSTSPPRGICGRLSTYNTPTTRMADIHKSGRHHQVDIQTHQTTTGILGPKDVTTQRHGAPPKRHPLIKAHCCHH